MHVSLVGVNYQTAPINIREKVAINADKLPSSLSNLRASLPGGIILSTCNRTEIYVVNDDINYARETSLNFLKAYLDILSVDLKQYVYVFEDRAAVEHLFRVASGLESMVIGEFEVLGQVRRALNIAEKIEMVNLPLRFFFHSAIHTGRRVREMTEISENAVSVSSIAVDLAHGITGDLARCKVLIIGTGEAGRLVAKVAKERGASQIVIASRAREKAQSVAASLNGLSVEINDIFDELKNTDTVITCSKAPHWILDVKRMERPISQRSGAPLVVIDIGVPRNVEPEVGRMKNVFLYNIDDLKEMSNTNRKYRESAVQQAEKIIGDEVDKFISWWQDYEFRPVVAALMSKAEKIRAAQLEKTLRKLPALSEEQMDNLEAMTKSIVTRVLKDPIQYLRNNGNSDHSDFVKELFQLDEANPQ
jgi:glutamyl-tRNA reductase